MHRKSVLIADDDAALLEALTLRCEGLGLTVRTADNGMSALTMALDDAPDLLILDLNMPAVDGLTVCEALVRDHRIPLFPILVLTGRSDHETIRRCVSTGAHYCLKGPDAWNKVEPVVRRLLEIETESSRRDVPAAAPDKAAAPKVLVIDDDPDFVRAIAARLQSFDVLVSVANNGKQGYWKALMESPDLIVTDLTMPEMSGEALMRKLMYTAETADTPIIVITGRRFEGKIDNALKREMESRHSVVAYLTKPFESGDLLDELRRHIALRPASQPAS